VSESVFLIAKTQRLWRYATWLCFQCPGVWRDLRTSEMISPSHKKAESFNQKRTSYLVFSFVL